MSDEQTNTQEPEAPQYEPCPCGKIPEQLIIEMPERAKFGKALCPCSEWGVEFRNGYTADPNETADRARKAWNGAPRAVPESSASS